MTAAAAASTAGPQTRAGVAATAPIHLTAATGEPEQWVPAAPLRPSFSPGRQAPPPTPPAPQPRYESLTALR